MDKPEEKPDTIGPLTVRFKTYLRPDGGIASVILEQFENEIQLTREQVISLVDTLERRLGI